MSDDLISRQMVDKIIDDLLENDNLQASPSVWHGLHTIKQLPSAQPEIIRCKDCKYAEMTIRGDSAKYCRKIIEEKDYTDAVYFDKDFFCAWAEPKEKDNA